MNYNKVHISCMPILKPSPHILLCTLGPAQAHPLGSTYTPQGPYGSLSGFGNITDLLSPVLPIHPHAHNFALPFPFPPSWHEHTKTLQLDGMNLRVWSNWKLKIFTFCRSLKKVWLKCVTSILDRNNQDSPSFLLFTTPFIVYGLFIYCTSTQAAHYLLIFYSQMILLSI